MSVETPVTSAWTAVAEAAAAVLPSSGPLSVLGESHDVTAGDLGAFAGAAVADLAAPATGRVALLVTDDVVQALADGPLGELSLASALQPAFDAIGTTLGAAAEVARELSVDELTTELGADLTLVSLGADQVSAGLAISSAVQPAAEANPATGGVQPTGSVRVATPAGGSQRGLEMLHGVVMDVTVELGRTKLPVRDLLALAPGNVIELDRAAGSPADLLVNGRLIARGEVVVIDEDFGLRITEIVEDQAGA